MTDRPPCPDQFDICRPQTGRAGTRRPGRRSALRLAVGLAAGSLLRPGRLLTTPAMASPPMAAQPFSDGATLLVAGPEGGRLDRLSTVLITVLDRTLAPGSGFNHPATGGADGVTGANQFDARTSPDGQTALLVPGDAALAWMCGDSRAKFDAAHWVPVVGGLSPGIVAGRFRSGPAKGGLVPGARPRIAAAGPTGPDLAALLGLELLGLRPVPVFGIQDATAARDALAHGSVDLVFLHGTNVPDQVAQVEAIGAQALFSLGAPVSAPSGATPASTPGQADAMGRDPLFPELPHLTELATRLRGTAPEGRLATAWRAAAIAAQLNFGLMLPPLTPAAMVALWRRAGHQSVAAPELQQTAAAQAFRLLDPVAANICIGLMTPDASSLLELRTWLGTRFNWQPG